MSKAKDIIKDIDSLYQEYWEEIDLPEEEVTEEVWLLDDTDFNPEEDIEENERALVHGNRIFSAYDLNDGTRLWCITEWDRGVTTLLLPSEY